MNKDDAGLKLEGNSYVHLVLCIISDCCTDGSDLLETGIDTSNFGQHGKLVDIYEAK